MKFKKSRSGDASLAFLDVITCGFGAILLLLIISDPVTVKTEMMEQKNELKSQIENTFKKISSLSNVLEIILNSDSKNSESAVEKIESSVLDQSIDDARGVLQRLSSDNEGLELVKDSLKRAEIQTTTNAQIRDPEVGGIPVDSDYVIFIIDTSGSMQQIWNRVTEVMGRVLDIHPKVKGFQVMNDNGYYLIKGTRGKWIPDTTRSRKNVINAMNYWLDFSNSSPVEGLERALRTYAKRKDKISIYILGDEFTGSSYDQVIRSIQKLNVSPTTGTSIVRIHSIGFLSGFENVRFATLMRALTENNRGAFLGMPW